MYSEFLGEWLASFPRDQLLFLRNEDYKVGGEGGVREVPSTCIWTSPLLPSRWGCAT